jgi:hypothetical protein
MNTTAHAGNGDKARHAEEATKKIARKFYVEVEGKTLDEARKIVEGLVAKGLLKDSVYYNAGITKHSAEEARVKERETRRAEEKAKEEQMKADFTKRKAEEAAKKQKPELEVTDEDRQFIQIMIDNANTIPQLKGYLQYKGYSSKVIKAFLDTLDLKKAKPRTASGMQSFMNSFIASPMSEETFKEYIDAGSENIKRHESLYRNMFSAFNAIHARYQS